MTAKQHIIVGAAFFVGVVLAHTNHRDLALLLIAMASMFVLVAERGE